MGRIPDHLLRLALRLAEGRWVTIGAKKDPKRPGKKKGGTPVEIDADGVIQKGPAKLTGKRPSELSQSHLFTGQDHKSQRKMFAEPGDEGPAPPPQLDSQAKPAAKDPEPKAKAQPKPKAKKEPAMSLLAVVRREGGISSGDFEHADFKEFGLLGALNKKGHSLDDMAATLVRQGHMVVPAGKSSPGDHLLQLLKQKTSSLHADKSKQYEDEYEKYLEAQQEAQADGHTDEQLGEIQASSAAAGQGESGEGFLSEIFGGDGSRGEEAGEPEIGDAAEPTGGVDTSFDFGPAAAPKVEPKPKVGKQRKPKQKQPGPKKFADPLAPKTDLAPPPKIDDRPKIGDKIQTRLGDNTEDNRPIEIDLMPGTKPGHFGIGEGGIKRKEIPVESFDNFIDDMTGKVSVPADSGVPEIDLVASGKGKHLGRGDDGSAFQVGDKVVKTSTVSPFIPTNPGHRTPQEGLNRLHDQTMTHNKLAEILKEKGVGGVEFLEWHEHGGRGFAISNLLDTKTKLNAQQIAKVRDTVDAIHDAGYVVGDDIQVGLNKNGEPVIYDLGKARKQDSNERERGYDLESDSSKFNKLAKQNGHDDIPPLRSDIKAELNRIKSSTGPFAQKIRDRLQAQLQQLNAGAAQQPETQAEKVQRLYSDYQDALAAKAKAKQEKDFNTSLFAAGKAARARGELEKLGLDPNNPPPSPSTNLFGQSEPTKPQPATTAGLFGDQVPVEDKKAPAAPPSVADDAAKGLDWLDKPQDKKTDGTGEMFGSLFSPGQRQAGPGEAPRVEPEPAKAKVARGEDAKQILANQKARALQQSPEEPWAKQGATPSKDILGSLDRRLATNSGNFKKTNELNLLMNRGWDKAAILDHVRDNHPDLYDALRKNQSQVWDQHQDEVKAHLGSNAKPEQVKAEPAAPPKIPDLKYVPLSKIDHPAQAAMGTYEKAKATAQERINQIRRNPRWNDGSRGRPADLQVEMMQAKSALDNANRGIEGAKATLERIANEQGKTTQRPAKAKSPAGEPATPPAVKPGKVIGKGSTGDVVRIGNEVHKNAKNSEAKIYKELAGVDGIAKGREEGGKIITPHFENILSRDDTPRERRQSFGPVLKDNLGRIIKAVNAISEKGYDYNDPLQFGFDDDLKAHLFDFSNAQKSESALVNNLGHLSSFLTEFGLPRHGNAIGNIRRLSIYLNSPETREFTPDAPESKDATKILRQLGGEVPKYAYYSFNARAIPSVAQTEKEPGPDGAKLVFSTKPLTKQFMDTWEIMPAIHKDQP